MGLFKFLRDLLDKLPIQGRVERWKNQKADLEKEKKALLKKKCTPKEAKRLEAIEKKISKLNQLLTNKAV